MEIERKFLVKNIPVDLNEYKGKDMVQGYLSVAPVVRVRREGTNYILTYKGGGMMARREENLPLDKESFNHLLEKCDGIIINKARYRIPLGEGYSNLTAELDVFEGELKGLVIVEVEFKTVDEAKEFNPPDWFGRDVTYDGRYHNSYLSKLSPGSSELQSIVVNSIME